MLRKFLPSDLVLLTNDRLWLYVSNNIVLIQEGTKLRIGRCNDSAFEPFLVGRFISNENAIKKDQSAPVVPSERNDGQS